MPLYFFHIQNAEYVADETGIDLRDIAGARNEMARAAGGIIASDLQGGASTADFTIYLEGADREKLLELTITAVMGGGQLAALAPPER